MTMKKIVSLFLLFLTIVGIAGGIGYSIYQGAWVIAVGLVAAGYMAYPKCMELVKNMTE